MATALSRAPSVAAYDFIVVGAGTAGRLADAAALLRDTLTRCEQALPPGHPLIQALRDTMLGAAGADAAAG